ncbi:ROK family protein [Mahella australiensis]|uniref:ROK family protein n=1 Tax=Mahella australiensis (strain DSM 15567 / CIP 107919 / 50-1 BON) TaxID=697281 RepID=F3ZZ66_MAHA5|nr:ROK family protein [Mahella australiensis]AEE97848.1 ROK family protein [Mahella australiensis 50-1 BON]
MAKGYNIELRKRNKYNRILNIIRNHENISRSEVKIISKYGMSTVLKGIDELLKQGLIVESGIGESQGGRRPIWLAVNPDGGYFVGIEFYSRRIFSVILNLTGEKIYDNKTDIEPDSNSAAILQSLKGVIKEMLDFLGSAASKVFGIGIGVPGQINKQAGISIEYGHIHGWSNIHIKDEIEKTFDIPAYIENNTKVMALAHKWLKPYGEAEDFLFLCIRSGIGMACMLNDQLYLGKNNNAGEIAHFALPNSNRRCYCGKIGCLDMEASNDAILSKIREGIKVGRFAQLSAMAEDPDAIDMDIFVQAVKMGYDDAMELLEETATYLGYALAAAINILNPGKIVIWGDISKTEDIFIEMLWESIRRYALSLNLQDLKIEYSQWGEDLGALGAATLIMQQEFGFFDAPI